MKINILFGFIVMALMAMTSCDDSTTDTLGTTLLDQTDNVSIGTAHFKMSSRSVKADAIWARSSTGYLGKVKDPETGGYITGSFMSQFNTLSGFSIESEFPIMIKEDGEVIADSCDITLFYTTFFGDSLATMKLTATELDHPMKETQHYASDFDPRENGYLRSDGLHQPHAYSLVNFSDGEQRYSKNYVHNIRIRLDSPYTSKDGTTYNNYGTYILRMIQAHPDYFQKAVSMMEHVIPGFYFEYSGGIGSMAYIVNPTLNVYYRAVQNDSIKNRIIFFSGTQEVLQTTKIANDEENLDQMVNNTTCSYVKTPAGIYTELTIPVDDIVNGHENDTINQAKFSIKRINPSYQNEYLLSAPKYLLAVHADSVASFFENSKVADNKYSFISAFSTTSNGYTFSNISTLISRIANLREAGLSSDSEWEAHHPNWNKVMLIPVSAEFRTSTNSSGVKTQTLIRVTHDLSLSSARLVGGPDALDIDIIYSKFK